MRKTCFPLVLILLIILLPIFVNEAVAVNETTMYIEPVMVQDISIGETFTINVSVADVQHLFSWQIKLFFNSTVLGCTEAVYPTTGWIFDDHFAMPIPPLIDNASGYVLHAASLMGDDEVSGSGILCQITFQVLTVGESTLKFSTPYGLLTLLWDGDFDLIPATIQDGFFTNLPTPMRDIAVTDLSLSNDHPKQNESISISVEVLNSGTEVETFNVSLFYDSNLIETQTGISLASGDSATLDFTWNTTGVPLGSHTIKAEATVLPGETDVANNVKTAPVIVVSPTALSTDLDGNGIVDMKDIAEVAKAYGTRADLDHPRWNPAADINGDEIINLWDLVLIAQDFGRIFS